MTFVRDVNSEILICRGARVFNSQGIRKDVKSYSWYIVKPSKGNTGVIQLHSTIFPKSMVGKRVKIKVEVIE